MRTLTCSILATAIFSLSPWASTHAADGVLEINQTCAAGPGCFPGDDPGFPVRIVNSGSYVLTSNLQVPQLVDGISSLISGDLTQEPPLDAPQKLNISLDLNGFIISSTTECSEGPVWCSPTSTTGGLGIFFGVLESGTAIIKNGTVNGMAFAGILCANECMVRDVVVSHNGNGGMTTNGSVAGAYAFLNGGNGIAIANKGTVTGSVATRNQNSGIQASSGSVVNNAVRFNGAIGIQAGGSSTVIGNQVHGRVDANSVGVSCTQCVLRDNNILIETAGEFTGTGVDFNNSAALFGGNLIKAEVAVVNNGNALQDGVNVCNGAACP